MKNILALALLIAGVSANSNGVNWENVKPLDIDRYIPVVPRAEGDLSGRITKGNLATPGQFPYQAGLMLYVANGAAWCGGSIISNQYILTAAHCTDALTTGVDVYLGAWDRTDKNEKHQQIIFVPTKYVLVHENWDPTTLSNDISLIKLPEAITFNEFIQPVKLPKVSHSYESYENEKAIASGWGRTSDQAAGATDKLQWIEVPVMTNSGCNTWFFGSVKPSNICIKTTGGYSTCNGDSGGPLVLAKDRSLIGVTSFGIALGCEKGWPGVFTRVTSYLDWIHDHTGVH